MIAQIAPVATATHTAGLEYHLLLLIAGFLD
jgi:hypothetical protein